MPRANRYFLPGHIWHITHRCHKQDFLLKFAYDRRAWIRWLFEAKKRFDLSILNYIATSSHIHLLVKDTGRNEIPKSMQLVAGRVAQEFNQRKKRKGAFWEDRYHATAIAADGHFARCLTYNQHLIDVPEEEDGLKLAIGETHRRYSRRYDAADLFR